MTERKRGNTATIDIDALLQNTWLQVISLRYGPVFQDGEGRRLWEHCIADVERVQRELKDSELSEVSCQHILTAQCALLDEAVKGRGVEDDACVQWYDIPLQGHFLGTMDAGDTLCDRMRDVLREPAPDQAVVTCFQRVMMLGFLGSYRSLNDPERQKLVCALSDDVTPFSYPQNHPVLAESHRGRRMGGWLASWPVRIGLSVVVVAALWWGLDHWLDQTLHTLLPGAVK
ncbi:type VI secretion system protein ImpK [Pantoea sp. PNA 14-12]|uniref:type VI secretion system protein TssL, short form n=1 Tax=Pantoea TaxID=53335 RepID=UPI0010607C18|nr:MULTISPECIES: type VI secretion system protein TssL, short form [Pantoea]MDF7785866.1 type VI secretion system protein TssL, short form [Pantoea stewartii]TDS70124.1 type VI secretion system protein ImpK [Pantoea sp. PNA 14-12]